ncbi:MAG: hypothetical protein ABIP45_05660 [Knoellia sp.]
MGGDKTTTLAEVAEHLNRRDGLEWMLVGSAATALRVGGITPMDIDIAVRRPEDVSRATTVLPTPQPLAPGNADDPPAWISTVAEPTLYFGDERERWSFGVWIIQGVKVELAHIDAPPVEDLMIETRSLAVWTERDTLTCQGKPVPTVPLETQLATMAARRQTARLDAVLAAIEISNSKLNLPLLRRAFADRQSESPGMVVPEPVEGLLQRGSHRGWLAGGRPSA